MKLYSEEEKQQAAELVRNEAWLPAWEKLTQPLHQQLVAAQSFQVLDSFPPAFRLMLILDYLEAQIGQGGFIQLFQNGYAPLLLEATELLQTLKINPTLQQVLDDALKIFATHFEQLGRETSVAEFAALYQQFPGFQPLEEKFNTFLPELKIELIKNAARELATG